MKNSINTVCVRVGIQELCIRHKVFQVRNIMCVMVLDAWSIYC